MAQYSFSRLMWSLEYRYLRDRLSVRRKKSVAYCLSVMSWEPIPFSPSRSRYFSAKRMATDISLVPVEILFPGICRKTT